MCQARGVNSEVIDNLRRVFQAVSDFAKAAEKSTGLTGPQLWAVKILASKSPMRVSDLARNMYLRPPTVVGILDRLERKGLITRTLSEEDRRVVKITLTAQGKVLATQAPEVVQDVLIKGLNELSNEQFTSAEEGMKLMVRVLGAEHLTPQPLHETTTAAIQL